LQNETDGDISISDFYLRFEINIIMPDKEDRDKLAQASNLKLDKEEQILAALQAEEKIELISHGPKNIEEMIEDYISHQNTTNDLKNPQKVEKNKPKGNVSIPSTENISSSPEITFGLATLSMIEEFMENEKNPENLEDPKSKGCFAKIFRCC